MGLVPDVRRLDRLAISQIEGWPRPRRSVVRTAGKGRPANERSIPNPEKLRARVVANFDAGDNFRLCAEYIDPLLCSRCALVGNGLTSTRAHPYFRRTASK